MGGRGSGGHNLISLAEHAQRGTLRPSRHASRLAAEQAPAAPVSGADRRRTLAGLGPEARRLAVGLLDQFDSWDTASLATLRLWAQSAERLRVMTDDVERRRETRTYLALLGSLGLDQ